MRKRLFSLALALALCLGLTAVPASAAGATLTEIISPETYEYLSGKSMDQSFCLSEGIIWNGGASAGAFDTTGKIIVEPGIYFAGFLRDFHEGIALVQRDKKTFGIDTNGRELFSLGSGEIDFSRVNSFSDGLCKMYSLSEKAYGYIDKSGKTVLPFEYAEKTGDFHDGLALVYDSANAYWGYIDKTGKLAIPYQFAQADRFYNGVAQVQLGNRWTLIDTTGKDLLPQQYQFKYDKDKNWIYNITPAGFVVEERNDRGSISGYMFINRAGQVVSDSFSSVDKFTNGMAKVRAKSSGMGKYGFLNENGVLAVPCQYSSAEDFRDGYALVQAQYDGPWNIIDKAGNVTGTIDKDKKPSNAGNGCFKISSYESGRSRSGFVDATGKEIVPCKYAEVKDFSGGVALVKNFDNKWGFVNTDGTEIVPCKYNWVVEVDSKDENGRQTNKSGIYRVSEEADLSHLKSSGWTAPATPSTPTTPTEPTGLKATPTTSTVLVNGEQVAFDAYNIDGSNYFKLRDLAYALNGSEKQFDVVWNASANAISLTSGKSYTAAGGELAPGSGAVQEALPTTSALLLDGADLALEAYNINGNNYFKLRDLGSALNFGVDWDGAANTVVIDTAKGYTP